MIAASACGTAELNTDSQETATTWASTSSEHSTEASAKDTDDGESPVPLSDDEAVPTGQSDIDKPDDDECGVGAAWDPVRMRWGHELDAQTEIAISEPNLEIELINHADVSATFHVVATLDHGTTKSWDIDLGMHAIKTEEGLTLSVPLETPGTSLDALKFSGAVTVGASVDLDDGVRRSIGLEPVYFHRDPDGEVHVYDAERLRWAYRTGDFSSLVPDEILSPPTELPGIPEDTEPSVVFRIVFPEPTVGPRVEAEGKDEEWIDG